MSHVHHRGASMDHKSRSQIRCDLKTENLKIIWTRPKSTIVSPDVRMNLNDHTKYVADPGKLLCSWIYPNSHIMVKPGQLKWSKQMSFANEMNWIMFYVCKIWLEFSIYPASGSSVSTSSIVRERTYPLNVCVFIPSLVATKHMFIIALHALDFGRARGDSVFMHI